MVRLRVCSGILALQKAFLFQFHYGAIKGPSAIQLNAVREIFQFHYGAIKGFRLPLQCPML